MAGSNDQAVRPPAVAGRFYPGEPGRCRDVAGQLLASARAGLPRRSLPVGGAKSAVGAIVPHAGWTFSGAIAALAMAQAAAAAATTTATLVPAVDLVVVFGAIHVPMPTVQGVLDTHEKWAIPGGELEVAQSVRDELPGRSAWFTTDDRFHEREHAVEVELPLIRAVWPNAAILPVQTPPCDQAVEIGEVVASRVQMAGLNAVYLASSDLTHYGPNYRFTPNGIGPAALDWAMKNDRRLLDEVLAMRPERIVPEARVNRNACGAGAIAAMMAACVAGGARRAEILRHTNSREIAPQSGENSVGYAAVVLAP